MSEQVAKFGELVATSAAMRQLFDLLGTVADSDCTILFHGETGTGKSVLAKELHARSNRASKPFFVVNCGAIPETLIESELFGHERGAFTGAHRSQIGAFEAANGGTIFLDEIGELPSAMQPKLLQVLEDHSFRRIGASQQTHVDVRVLAATNRNLEVAVEQGRFRPDLYHRLNVVSVRIPSLAERPEDIPLLATYFYQQFAGKGQTPPPDLLELLSQRALTGNVRELRNIVERNVLLGDSELWDVFGGRPEEATGRMPAVNTSPFDPDSELRTLLGEFAPAQPPTAAAPQPAQDLPSLFDPMTTYRDAKERLISAWEKRYIVDLLRWSRGNVSRAARAAGMNRTHLQRLLQRHGIKASDHK